MGFSAGTLRLPCASRATQIGQARARDRRRGQAGAKGPRPTHLRPCATSALWCPRCASGSGCRAASTPVSCGAVRSMKRSRTALGREGEGGEGREGRGSQGGEAWQRAAQRSGAVWAEALGVHAAAQARTSPQPSRGGAEPGGTYCRRTAGPRSRSWTGPAPAAVPRLPRRPCGCGPGGGGWGWERRGEEGWTGGMDAHQRRRPTCTLRHPQHRPASAIPATPRS